jgi:hypothetical protein
VNDSVEHRNVSFNYVEGELLIIGIKAVAV